MGLKAFITKRRLIFVIVFIVSVSSLGIVAAFFKTKSFKFSEQLSGLESDYAQIISENQKLKDDYKKLQSDYQSLDRERDNLIRQAKKLIGDSNLARELETKIKELGDQMQFLREEKQQTEEKNDSLRNSIEKLEKLHQETVNEKLRIEAELDKARDASLLKKTEQEKSNLQNKNQELLDNLKQANSNIQELEDRVAKLRTESNQSTEKIEELSSELEGVNRRYAEAVKKNKEFEKRSATLPKKFNEIARQNKVLVKRTANMHYNLGVFYTKQKEYSRAIVEYEKALQLNPDDAYAHFNLGYIYAEYQVNRSKAIEHFQDYLRLSKKSDKDVDWVKKYILTWQTWEGKQSVK